MFALLMGLSVLPAFAYWQDDARVAEARTLLGEWEQRFVNAVNTPELQWVQQDLTKNKTYQQPQRVRNFPRYLAKVDYTYRQLQAAEKQYASAVKAAKADNDAFVDLDYKRNPELDNALSTWNALLQEVGEQTVKEASDAYAGEEAMLKSSTDY
jgi:hypothetical protein